MDPVLNQIDNDVRLIKKSFPASGLPLANPYIVLLTGLPGSGKTFVGTILENKLSLKTIETDAVRKCLTRVPMYNAYENGRLFRACHKLMEELLSDGIPVLLDATNLLEKERESVYEIAKKVGAELLIIKVAAPSMVIKRRLMLRDMNLSVDGASNAGRDVYTRMRAREEPVRKDHVVLDTAKDMTSEINEIVKMIENFNKS